MKVTGLFGEAAREQLLRGVGAVGDGRDPAVVTTDVNLS